jgi:hypothetical protein
MSQLLSGTRNAGPQTRQKIVDAFGLVDFDQLFEEICGAPFNKRARSANSDAIPRLAICGETKTYPVRSRECWGPLLRERRPRRRA